MCTQTSLKAVFFRKRKSLDLRTLKRQIGCCCNKFQLISNLARKGFVMKGWPLRLTFQKAIFGGIVFLLC